MDRGTVAISNGFHKMHLTTAAREANERGLLSLVVTGAYPTPLVGRLLRTLRLAGKGRIGRILQRDEGLPSERLHAVFWPEILDGAVSALVGRLRGGERLRLRWSALMWGAYGRIAGRKLRRAGGARLFQYRAGFGGRSVETARRRGMVILCDHALAHPLVLRSLVEERGLLPERGTLDIEAETAALDPLSQIALRDIDACDAVVVNSHFVRETFLRVGWAPERVHVAYTGVDDNFLRIGGPPPRRVPAQGPLPLLYASVLSQRKGAETLIDALRLLGDRLDWSLVVAGPVSPEIEARHGEFLSDPRVRVTGPLNRPDFKAQMIERPIFVFPSWAEGSARAVFDALACGCYAITTPNAGSIVEDGVHGALVPAGDAEATARAIVGADRDRERVAEIGNRNASLIVERYRQTHYGDALAAIYNRLLESAAA